MALIEFSPGCKGRRQQELSSDGDDRGASGGGDIRNNALERSYRSSERQNPADSRAPGENAHQRIEGCAVSVSGAYRRCRKCPLPDKEVLPIDSVPVQSDGKEDHYNRVLLNSYNVPVQIT